MMITIISDQGLCDIFILINISLKFFLMSVIFLMRNLKYRNII